MRAWPPKTGSDGTESREKLKKEIYCDHQKTQWLREDIYVSAREKLASLLTQVIS